MKKIITSALLLLVATMSCKVTEHGGRTTEIYRYVNESSVEVALVGEVNDNFKIPDSLVLQNGDSFECSTSSYPLSPYQEPFPYKAIINEPNRPIRYIPIKVYYDKKICISYIETDKGKNPLNEESYNVTSRKEKKKYNIYTYTLTFTTEDYQNVLKAQE